MTDVETAEQETASRELDALDPIPEVFTLSNGLEIEFQPMKTLQFFALLRILTRGSSGFINQMQLDPEASPAQFATQFLAIMVLAIPEADEETIEFLRAMTKPKGWVANPSSSQRPQMEQLRSRYNEAFENPELEDLLGIIEAIIKRESQDIQSLGKRLLAMMTMATKTGAAPTELLKTSSSETIPTDSSEDSLAPLTT